MKCGTKVESRCSSCNTVNPAEANFCRKCGGALGSAAPTSSSPGPAAAAKTRNIAVTPERQTAEGLDGERKTVTALFADIKGSTELMEDLDPEEARAIIDPALKLMIEAVRRYDGYVAQSTGDGIFALFGAPIAHEDHPQRALYAALRYAGGLKRYSDQFRQDGRLPITGAHGREHGRSRCSIDSDWRRARRVHADRPYGQSRIADAGPGSDRLDRRDRDTSQLCEGYFMLRSLGPTPVKGFASR